MDVAAGGVAVGAAHVDLVVQLGQERLGVNGGAAGANQARAACGHGGDLQGLGGRTLVVALGLGRVDLHEVGAQAQRDAGGARDQVRVLLSRDGLAARVDPQHDQQAVGMGGGDELAGLGQHGGLVLAAQVDGVAQAHDVHAVVAHGEHGLQVVQLRAVRIFLGGLDQVGLGVHLHQVVDVGVIGGILRDKTTLASQNAAHALIADLEEMLRLGIGDVDALAVEVLVQVLNLLVAREQHETARATGGLHVVVDVRLADVCQDVGRYLHLVASDLGHDVPPYRMQVPRITAQHAPHVWVHFNEATTPPRLSTEKSRDQSSKRPLAGPFPPLRTPGARGVRHSPSPNKLRDRKQSLRG